MLPWSGERVCNNHCCRVDRPYLATLLAEARAVLEATSTPLFDSAETYDLFCRIDQVLAKEETFELVR